MQTRIVNESFLFKTRKEDLSIERQVNRRLQNKYEKEHQKTTKALAQIAKLKDKNKGNCCLIIVFLELRNNLNQIEDKFLNCKDLLTHSQVFLKENNNASLILSSLLKDLED